MGNNRLDSVLSTLALEGREHQMQQDGFTDSGIIQAAKDRDVVNRIKEHVQEMREIFDMIDLQKARYAYSGPSYEEVKALEEKHHNDTVMKEFNRRIIAISNCYYRQLAGRAYYG